jgi:hypothetical protein
MAVHRTGICSGICGIEHACCKYSRSGIIVRMSGLKRQYQSWYAIKAAWGSQIPAWVCKMGLGQNLGIMGGRPHRQTAKMKCKWNLGAASLTIIPNITLFGEVRPFFPIRIANVYDFIQYIKQWTAWRQSNFPFLFAHSAAFWQ